MLNAAATASPSLPVAIAEVVSHRPYLVRFALRKLRDPALAEDAVHDVIEAVLSGRARFDDGDDDERPGHDVACDRAGPEEIAARREELAHALDGIERLPATLRDAIVLRVIEERPTAAVCAELGISEENLFVRVHRARRQLAS